STARIAKFTTFCFFGAASPHTKQKRGICDGEKTGPGALDLSAGAGRGRAALSGGRHCVDGTRARAGAGAALSAERPCGAYRPVCRGRHRAAGPIRRDLHPPAAGERCAGPAAGRAGVRRSRTAEAAGRLRAVRGRPLRGGGLQTRRTFLAPGGILCYSMGNYHIKRSSNMTEQEILAAVQDIFRDNFDDDSLVITRDTCADDIEDWDSLEQINLLTAIEKKFGIKFKLADVRNLKDVGDLLDLVARMV